MFNRMIDGFTGAIKILLPDSSMPTLQWVARLATLMSIAAIAIGVPFVLLRNTELGKKYGINSPETFSPLSNRAYRDIETVIYTYLSRIREDNPEMRTAVFLAIYDENGNIGFSSKQARGFGVFSWFAPNTNYVSFGTLENVIAIVLEDQNDTLVREKKCVSLKISPVNIQRFSQAIEGFSSNYLIACPAPDAVDSDVTFGAVLTFYNTDSQPPNLAADTQKQLLESTKGSAYGIAGYLRSRKDLQLNQHH